ncbi:UNVERIFIED_CONTAM: hypothetical protein RMT77_003307 [Armadillidium vulgare]
MFRRVSDFVHDALYRKTANENSSQAVIWGLINSVVFSVLFYDLNYGGFTSSSNLLWWCAFSISIICLINIFIHLKIYLMPILVITPMEVTDKQRKLLSISESDIGFKSPSFVYSTSTPKQEKSPKLSELFEATTIRTPPQSPHSQGLSPMNLTSNKSWFHGSSSLQSPSLLSLNQSPTSISPSVTANSWSFHRMQQSPLHDTSYGNVKQNLFNTSGLPNSNFGKSISFTNLPMNMSLPLSSSPISQLSGGNRGSSILNKSDLENYLQDFREKEIKKQSISLNENTNGGSNSFWAYNTSSNMLNFDLINSLRQNVYQVAFKDAGIKTNSSLSKIDDSKMSYYSSSSVSKIWLKRNVTPKDLFKYEENFRIWLAMNVLQPLVQMIDSCIDALTAVAPELKVGSVGVDKLKKAAQNISGIKQLNYLIPFLDLTLHQDYLVSRLRELSKGGAISAFQWNAGGSFNGNPWRDEYPTDTMILLHLFSVYMDNHLPPDPTQPDGRVFSNIHVVKTPEKPPSPCSHPCLYLTQINPPHLKVVLPSEGMCEVGGGHKNFFHSLILFCYYIVNQQHSHIAGVNLKLSGINLAWVVNAE